MSILRPILLLTLISFAYFYLKTDACSCLRATREQKYNASDFVSRVKILASYKGKYEVVYDVEHLQVYKPQFDVNTTLPQRIHTASFDAACGVTNLHPKKEYLLNGEIDLNGTLRINLCSTAHSLVRNGQRLLDEAGNETEPLNLDPLLNEMLKEG